MNAMAPLIWILIPTRRLSCSAVKTSEIASSDSASRWSQTLLPVKNPLPTHMPPLYLHRPHAELRHLIPGRPDLLPQVRIGQEHPEFQMPEGWGDRLKDSNQDQRQPYHLSILKNCFIDII